MDSYVTIWSRSSHDSLWVIERTHTESYVLSLIGLRLGEWANIRGRDYGVFNEGINPNKIKG